MAASAAYLRQAGLFIRTIYIGGGTPTTLTAPQLERLLTQVEQCFDLSRLTEYTVEAGRPDTITADKLAVLKAHPTLTECRSTLSPWRTPCWKPWGAAIRQRTFWTPTPSSGNRGSPW